MRKEWWINVYREANGTYFYGSGWSRRSIAVGHAETLPADDPMRIMYRLHVRLK